MVVHHAFSPSTRVTEAGVFLGIQPELHKRVPGQQGLHRKPYLKKTKPNQNKTKQKPSYAEDDQVESSAGL